MQSGLSSFSSVISLSDVTKVGLEPTILWLRTTRVADYTTWQCLHKESNFDPRLRRSQFCPLNYRGFVLSIGIEPMYA